MKLPRYIDWYSYNTRPSHPSREAIQGSYYAGKRYLDIVCDLTVLHSVETVGVAIESYASGVPVHGNT